MLDFFMDNFYTSNELLVTKISEIEYTVLDFETTGLYPFNGDQIIEVGLYKMNSNGNVIKTYESLINPLRPIPDDVSKINSISDDMVKNAPTIEEKIDEIMSFIKNTVIVAHNLSFDMSFLNFQLQKMNRPKVDQWMVDTIKVSKIIFPNLERYSLKNITKELKIKNREAHRALADCEATGALLKALIDSMPHDAILKDLQAFKIH